MTCASSGRNMVAVDPNGITIRHCDVFLSYAREDVDRMIEARLFFESRGFSVYCDQRLVAGPSWKEQLKASLKRCTRVVAQSFAWLFDKVRGEAPIHRHDDPPRPAPDPELMALAERHWQAAADLIAATGYHRRDGDLAQLRVALDGIEHMQGGFSAFSHRNPPFRHSH